MANCNSANPSHLHRAIGLIRLIRPKQWIKNGFVLAPLIFTGKFLDPLAIKQTFLAGFLFSIASSATYIINDLHDVDRDRQHPRKSKTRPLASGLVSSQSAIALLVALYGALAMGWWLQPQVISVIVVYLALNLAYTFVLKHQPVIDIFTIAIGFVLRVYAGALALDVPSPHGCLSRPSAWRFIWLRLNADKNSVNLAPREERCSKIFRGFG